jgi:hypothetical protein
MQVRDGYTYEIGSLALPVVNTPSAQARILFSHVSSHGPVVIPTTPAPYTSVSMDIARYPVFMVW